MFRKIKSNRLPKSSIKRTASEPVSQELIDVLNASFERFTGLGMKNVFCSIPASVILDTDQTGRKKYVDLDLYYGFTLSTDSKIQFYYRIWLDVDKVGDVIQMSNTPMENSIDIGNANSSSYNLVNDNIGRYLAELITNAVSGVVITTK